ncbi:MAG TPA: YqgE/AlgH family protein [Alphaproteobacteria bacterium]|nr:YqgE/AlgH family protein [Alphaproteobacteria bacterium]
MSDWSKRFSDARKAGYLDGQLLLATPSIGDDRFARTVIYMCAHDKDHALGLVINRRLNSLTFRQLLGQLDIDVGKPARDVVVHSGGPVEEGRGFVLHSADYVQESTLIISETVALTATVDILKAIAVGEGPTHSLLAIGCAGWGPGQLEQEIQMNGWLHTEADDELIFHTELSQKWSRAMSKIGVDVSMLSSDVGHA